MIKNTLWILAGLLLLALAVVAIIAAGRPDTFRVSRSATIAAPAEKIFPLINDLRQFDSWNPYALKDPQMKASYSGPASGPGARSTFDSKKAGSGSLEIVQAAAPSQVQMRLLMTGPFKADNNVVFTLAPQGNGTQTSWTMQGPAPFLARCMGVIFNMDKMVGADFEAGLANLKARAEKT